MGKVKDMFTNAVLAELGNMIAGEYKSFNKSLFLEEVFNDEWEQLELFDRLSHISNVLIKTLPPNYKKSLNIIYSIIPNCNLPQGMIFPQFVIMKGIDDLEESSEALEKITEYSTCEFAVRPLIDKYPDRMQNILQEWSLSKNEHVRRLASEGTRFSIPWGSRLQILKSKPKYAIDILSKLNNDSSLYVRNSVSNNLNELSKIEPDLVVTVCREWLKNGEKNTQQVVKKACRTLLKKSFPPVMEMYGLKKPDNISVKINSASKNVKLDEALLFNFEINNKQKECVKLKIGYDIGFLKSNKKIKYKSVRISERTCKSGITEMERKHIICETSSRKIYKGQHELKITLNGCIMAEAEFKVV